MRSVMLVLLARMWMQATPAPPGVVIDHVTAAGRQYVGSPSIVILPKGEYVATHDLFGKGSTQTTSAVTRVFRSKNKGKSWEKTAEFSEMTWGNLFLHKGALYLMGCSYEYGRPVIRRSGDGGKTWSKQAYLAEGKGCHTAPVPMAVKDGRIWRAFEWHPEGKWGFFESFVVSAPVDADLMDAKSWSPVGRLAYPANAVAGQHWLEGNVVVAPDGGLVNILRVANVEKAAVVRVRGDKLEFDRLIDFPGGAKKFSIRFDPKSKLYWTLSNPAPAGAKDPASMRNTLVLMSSADLMTWQIRRTVLTHPDAEKHAFQYVDWQFEKNDLVVASRTAFDDDEGGAPRGHDANFLTFHRVKNFRK
ncbi:MAG TPA: sialidase family protein [Paludibaculum sp.]|jgi:hypothetical protein